MGSYIRLDQLVAHQDTCHGNSDIAVSVFKIIHHLHGHEDAFEALSRLASEE